MQIKNSLALGSCGRPGMVLEAKKVNEQTIKKVKGKEKKKRKLVQQIQ